jgi:hypothetical protein
MLSAQDSGNKNLQLITTTIVNGDTATTKWQPGINLVQQFNNPILHSIVGMEISKKGHFLYAGLHYTHLLENYFGDEVMGDLYDENTFGLNFGYKYLNQTKWKRLSVVLQLDFLVYRVHYKQWGGHVAGVQEKNPIILENNGGIGLNYVLSQKMSVSAGFGLSSPAGFFLLLDQVNPHSWIGLHYRLN